MRTSIMIAVIALFIPLNAQAEKHRPFTIVGLWDVTTTIQGLFIHHTIDLREGGGQESLYASKGGEHGNSTVNVMWNFENKTLTRFAQDGNTAHSTIEIISRTKIAITHGEDGFPPLRGLTLIYNLNEQSNEGGCQLEPTADTQTTDHAIATKKKRRRYIFV